MTTLQAPVNATTTMAVDTSLDPRREQSRIGSTPLNGPTSYTVPLPTATGLFVQTERGRDFDAHKVLKSGEVNKRTRKTRWKRFHLVLRHNLLSIYKNPTEDRLHKQIALSDLTAVTPLKDPKGRREHMFGLFSPSRNYHFQAPDETEANEWVDLIKYGAHIDEEEKDEELFSNFGSPLEQREVDDTALSQTRTNGGCIDPRTSTRVRSSSPECPTYTKSTRTRDGIRVPGVPIHSHHELDYSGPDYGSHSDFSDAGPSRSFIEPTSFPYPLLKTTSTTNPETEAFPTSPVRPNVRRNASQQSVLQSELDGERVIWHGSLFALKSKGGVRAWRRLWAVLRSKNLALYKNEEEYSAHRLISLSSILNAVEIDPISRSKAHCMQIIVEDRSYRFCAQSEEELASCLGAIKSQLAKRRGKETTQRIVSY